MCGKDALKSQFTDRTISLVRYPTVRIAWHWSMASTSILWTGRTTARRMRLALLCLIGLIESIKSVYPTASNIGDHSGQQFNRRPHSSPTYPPNFPYPHSKSPHPHNHSHLERVKRQKPDFNSTEKSPSDSGTTRPSNLTDSSKETGLTTNLTSDITMNPMAFRNATPNQTTSSKRTTSFPILSNRTESTTANPTTATPAGPRSTSLFLHFIWTLTILFMIGSMVALYYLKTFAEKLNPKKGDSFSFANQWLLISTKSFVPKRLLMAIFVIQKTLTCQASRSIRPKRTPTRAPQKIDWNQRQKQFRKAVQIWKAILNLVRSSRVISRLLCTTKANTSMR